jgi:hypothetical protein
MEHKKQKTIGLSEADAALYDRQIRLWGMDTQKRYDAYIHE